MHSAFRKSSLVRTRPTKKLMIPMTAAMATSAADLRIQIWPTLTTKSQTTQWHRSQMTTEVMGAGKVQEATSGHRLANCQTTHWSFPRRTLRCHRHHQLLRRPGPHQSRFPPGRMHRPPILGQSVGASTLALLWVFFPWLRKFILGSPWRTASSELTQI